MKVFIDTNILLDIYHLSGPDLEELRKLKRMVEKEKVQLLVSTQVVDEFWRNRERVIADAMKTFRQSKAAAKIPNIIRIYPEAKQLTTAVNGVNEMIKALANKATADIENDALKADEVVGELFAAVSVGDITEEMFARAQRRVAVGNPPGKANSLGDALNWEWLLEQEIDFWDDELVLISSDGDFESELVPGTPREFLLREWKERNPTCELVLEKSLPSFLLKYFPDIHLSEEVDKSDAITGLEESRSFASTHLAIAGLAAYDDFNDAEVKRILRAYTENGQIWRIIEDHDVRGFAEKLISLARTSEAKELAEPVQRMLRELEDADDDEFPF